MVLASTHAALFLKGKDSHSASCPLPYSYATPLAFTRYCHYQILYIEWQNRGGGFIYSGILIPKYNGGAMKVLNTKNRTDQCTSPNQQTNLLQRPTPHLGLYTIFFYCEAIVHESTILSTPAAHLHCQPWRNTIARLSGSIRLPLRTLVCELYTTEYW